jgi:hypothetical protein
VEASHACFTKPVANAAAFPGPWVCAKTIRCPISLNKTIRFPKNVGCYWIRSIRSYVRPNKTIRLKSFQVLHVIHVISAVSVAFRR